MPVIGLQAGSNEMAGYILVGIPILLFMVFVLAWLWTLVDCVRHEPEGNEKLIWIVVILLFGFVGAFFYSVGRRKKRIKLYGE